jgi:hypothetical protein
MNIAVSIDLSAFNAHLVRLSQLARNETIPFIADKNKDRILQLTASGADYEGEIFHDYGESQRAKRIAAGLEVDVKNLFFTGDMLGSLAFLPEQTALGVEGVLTVGEDYQQIALGQQTGHSGDWGYEHRFIGVSDEGRLIAAEDWKDYLVGALNA